MNNAYLNRAKQVMSHLIIGRAPVASWRARLAATTDKI